MAWPSWSRKFVLYGRHGGVAREIGCSPAIDLRQGRPAAERGVARMARFGVRSGAGAFAGSDEDPLAKPFERTGANRCERSLALAMQKVEGSSPFIRFKKSPVGG